MNLRIVKYILYPIFFVFCLFFFLIQSFPIGVVGDRLVQEVRNRLDMKLSYTDLETLFPNGIRVKGLKLSATPKDDQENDAPMTLRIQEAQARISLFSLLSGTQKFDFDADLLEGKVEGSFRHDGDAIQFQLKLSDINLSRVPMWPEILGVDLAGNLSSEVQLTLPYDKENKKNPRIDIKKAEGDIQLSLEAAQFGNAQPEGMFGLKLPWISLGKTSVSIKIQNGKADVKEFKVASDAIPEATLAGYLMLQPAMTQISSHLRITFKPSEAKIQEILEQLPPELRDTIHAQINQQLDQAKGKDGRYRYSIFGRIFAGKPQFRPLKQ